MWWENVRIKAAVITAVLVILAVVIIMLACLAGERC
jgi:hypothetical protein